MAEIIQMPGLWNAEVEVRNAKRFVEHWQNIIDSEGDGRKNPDMSVHLAEKMLPDACDRLRKAEAALASVQAGSALQHNGIVYAAMAGRA